MALAVKSIPTLYGEEAREFRERADEVERRYMERPKRDLNNDPRILAERKGRAEGEKSKAVAIARKLKAKGFSADDIMEITGLTTDAISLL